MPEGVPPVPETVAVKVTMIPVPTAAEEEVSVARRRGEGEARPGRGVDHGGDIGAAQARGEIIAQTCWISGRGGIVGRGQYPVVGGGGGKGAAVFGHDDFVAVAVLAVRRGTGTRVGERAGSRGGPGAGYRVGSGEKGRLRLRGNVGIGRRADVVKVAGGQRGGSDRRRRSQDWAWSPLLRTYCWPANW